MNIHTKCEIIVREEEKSSEGTFKLTTLFNKWEPFLTIIEGDFPHVYLRVFAGLRQ